MMAPYDKIKVGLVGFGIGKVYAAALKSVPLYYPDMPPVELVGVATTSSEKAAQAVRRMGFEFGTTDYRQLLSNPEINTLLLAAPNRLHFSMLQAALETDKAILTDKPLTCTLDEAEQLIRQARQSGRNAQIMFELRYCPALQHAHHLIQEGRLGEIYSVRAEYFRSSYSNPAKPLRWKASAAQGGGVLNDLGSHMLDLIQWLIGLPVRVNGQMRTYVPLRPVNHSGKELERVETDDHSLVQLEFPGGSLGSLEVGRLVTGATNDARLAIYGSQASLRWSVMDGNYLYLAERENTTAMSGWQKIPTVQRYADADLPGADFTAGFMRYIIACLADFIRRSATGQGYDPDLLAGANVQAILEAVEHSARQSGWVEVSYPGLENRTEPG